MTQCGPKEYLTPNSEPFSEPDAATVQVLFSNSDIDVSAPASGLFASAFSPTAILVITGKDGRITGVETRSWRNGQWISTGHGETLPGVEVATQNNLLEGAVKWGDLGYPLPPDADLTRQPVSLRYGIITSLRASSDVIGPKFRMVTTPIRSDSWGDVKASRTDGAEGPR
jgi:hypothetical protein